MHRATHLRLEREGASMGSTACRSGPSERTTEVAPTSDSGPPGRATRQPGHAWIAMGLTAAVFGLTGNHRLFSAERPDYQHLGGEYYNIARALADGRGFSDPFGEATGSTAWMPPLYPFMLATLLLVLKKKALVAAAIVIMTNFSYAAVGWMIFRMAERTRRRISPLVALGLYLGWLCVFYDSFFMTTHDIWLAALLLAFIARALCHHADGGGVRPSKWGLLGGFAAAISPAVASAWGVVTLLGFVRLRAHRRGLAAAMAIALLMAAPWTLRNATVFHRFIPVKSNLFYDAYQANYLLHGGVYVAESKPVHPYNSPEARFHYAQLGETGFMDESRQKLMQAVRVEPGRWLVNIGRRLLASTVLYVPFGRDESPWRIVRHIAFALPFLGLLVGLRARAPRSIALLAVFYFIYLIPYVLVAFYFRYFAPLTSIAVLFVWSAIDGILAGLDRSRGFVAATDDVGRGRGLP